MRLYAHNFFVDENGKHYKIEALKKRIKPSSYTENDIYGFLKILNLEVFKQAMKDIEMEFEIPSSIENLTAEDIARFNHFLFEIDVFEGYLISESGQRYPVIAGVPDFTKSIPN